GCTRASKKALCTVVRSLVTVCVDQGSGTGVLGIAAGLLGHKVPRAVCDAVCGHIQSTVCDWGQVIVTDVQAALPALQQNVQLNAPYPHPGSVRAASVDWMARQVSGHPGCGTLSHAFAVAFLVGVWTAL